MKGLIQRVSSASVYADGVFQGAIGNGLVVLLAVEEADTQQLADKMLNKILRYRIFEDNEGKMNIGLLDCQGGLVIVSQFTLAANTSKGLRPSFTGASNPQKSEQLYDYFVAQAKQQVPGLVTGIFGSDMLIDISNRGPATFMLSA
jgi:D-aminoacyl-tRNA deacylase